MKNLFIAFAFLLVSLCVQAQSQKIPLIEHFTNTKCSICKSKNPKFYNLFAPYQIQIHHVSIHPSVPYADCALYQANKPDNGARQSYYQVFGTPLGYMNGVEASNGTNIFTKEELDQSLLESSPIEMKVVENTGADRLVTVEIKTTGIPSAGNYKLHLMAVEKELNYNSPNGETLHRDVMRKMIPDFNGTDISLQSAGFDQTFTFNYSIPAAWVESQMYVIAFVQNQDTKEILNSGSKLIQTSAIKNQYWVAGNVSIANNPLQNFLNLRFDGLQPVAGSFQVLSTGGQQVYAAPFGLATGINRLMDTSLLANGIYFLQLISPSGIWQGSFVKN